MEIMNLTLYGFLFVVQLFYAWFWNGISYGVLVVNVLRIFVVLAVKAAFFLLVMEYGTKVSVKSHLLSNNDLLIIGTD